MLTHSKLFPLRGPSWPHSRPISVECSWSWSGQMGSERSQILSALILPKQLRNHNTNLAENEYFAFVH